MNATAQNLERYLSSPAVLAFLDLISWAEGTERYGYFTLVGNTQLASIAQHPRIVVARYNSSAAGRYQFLAATWDDDARALGLTDFSEHSQDLAALWEMQKKGALDRVLTGDITGAIDAVKKVWASFPGANYPGQGMKPLPSMLARYSQAYASRAGTGGAAPISGNGAAPALLAVFAFVLLLRKVTR